MAATEYVAEWDLSVSHLLSREQLTAAGRGFLGVEYADGCDTRWGEKVTLGPLLTVIDLDDHDSTATIANTIGFALSNGLNATKYIYVARGEPVTKVKASDMTLVNPGTLIELAEAATDILYTKNAGGVEEISYFMAATAYHVITASGNPTVADTAAANTDSQIARIAYPTGGNTSKPRITALNGQGMIQNVIASGTTMSNGDWVTRATRQGAGTPTGLAMDGNFVIPGYSDGPYFLNDDFHEYQPIFQELALADDTNNCKNMRAWDTAGLGILMPVANGLRFQKNLGGYSIGPETYGHLNTSPIQGRVAALAFTMRWGYMAYYNSSADITYLVAFRPRTIDDWHDRFLSFYVIAKLGAGIQCDAMEYIGKYGGRTSDTLIGGNDDDMWWMTIGAFPVETDDSNYRFASSGTTYLTEMRRHPGQLKRIKRFEFKTTGCDSGKTVKINVQLDGGTAQQFGATITTNKSKQRLWETDDNPFVGEYIKPQVVLATDSSSSTPAIVGKLLMYYTLEPLDVDGKYA